MMKHYVFTDVLYRRCGFSVRNYLLQKTARFRPILLLFLIIIFLLVAIALIVEVFVYVLHFGSCLLNRNL